MEQDVYTNHDDVHKSETESLCTLVETNSKLIKHVVIETTGVCDVT